MINDDKKEYTNHTCTIHRKNIISRTPTCKQKNKNKNLKLNSPKNLLPPINHSRNIFSIHMKISIENYFVSSASTEKKKKNQFAIIFPLQRVTEFTRTRKIPEMKKPCRTVWQKRGFEVRIYPKPAKNSPLSRSPDGAKRPKRSLKIIVANIYCNALK